MDIDFETVYNAYKTSALLKGIITYIIPILMFLVICLINIKLGEVQYELKKIKQIINDKEEQK